MSPRRSSSSTSASRSATARSSSRAARRRSWPSGSALRSTSSPRISCAATRGASSRAFALRWPGELLLLPSIKANSSLALRRILTDEGTGCDVFGQGELEAALRTGHRPGRISLNGPMKDDALLERAIRAGRPDHARQPRRARPHRGGRRPARQPRRGSAFGFGPTWSGFDEPSEMSPDGRLDPRRDPALQGGHPDRGRARDRRGRDRATRTSTSPASTLHLGRHSADPAIWRAAIDCAVRSCSRALRARWGGWTPARARPRRRLPGPARPVRPAAAPARRRSRDRSPGIDEYAEAICSPPDREPRGARDRSPLRCRLELEPGRALYADAGIHLATVGNVKRQTEPIPLTWVETDSSDAYLPDVNLELNRWSCLPVSNAAAEAPITADVTGRTCALDVIVADAELPPVGRATCSPSSTPAPTRTPAATNFNALPRPGTALVTGDEAELIRRHETLEDVFARDLIPERLRGEPDAAAGGNGWRATGIDHVSVTCGDLDRSLALLLRPARPRAAGARRGGRARSSRSPGIAEPQGALGRPRAAPRAGAGADRVRRPARHAQPAGAQRPGRDPHLAAGRRRRRRPQPAAGGGRQRRGEPTTIDAPGAWKGARVFYSTDPDGVTVELIQPPNGGAG